MSKGSGRRPQQVEDKSVVANWDRIFKPTPPEHNIPVGHVESFGGSGDGWSAVIASISPDWYSSETDQWIMTCEVSCHHVSRGSFRTTLPLLCDTNRICRVTDCGRSPENPRMIDAAIVKRIKEWAEVYGFRNLSENK